MENSRASSPERIASSLERDTLYSTQELESAGLSRPAIRRLLAGGVLDSPATGVYLHADNEPHEFDDLAAVAKRCPEAVFNLYTAARYHGITQAVPADIWIGIPHKNAPVMGGGFHLDLRVLRWSRPEDVESDVETFSMRGVELRFTGEARTVVDMWRYSSHNPHLRGEPRIHDENLLQCVGAYLEKTGGATRELGAAARRLKIGPATTDDFFRFCQNYAGGFTFGQTF